MISPFKPCRQTEIPLGGRGGCRPVCGLIVMAALLWSATALTAATTYYVDLDAVGAESGDSWSNAFTTVTNALAVASSGDAIWIAEGVYVPGSASDDTFLLANGLSLYGGFSGTETNVNQRDGVLHPTVLSGDMGGGTYARHVVTGYGLLDSLIVRDGRGVSSDRGGGWNVSGGTGNVTARDCVFTNNFAPSRGGALSVNSSLATVELSGCTFVANVCTGSLARGGAVYIYNSLTNCAPMAVSNCVFRGNVADMASGLMVDGYFDPLLIIGSTFATNQTTLTVGTDGGAVSLMSLGTDTEISGCVFSNNVSRMGAGVLLNNNKVPDALITNCAFYGNSAQLGGGIASTGGDRFRVYNCTFIKNSSSVNDGGAIRPYTRVIDLRDSVFSGNRANSYGAGVSIYDTTGKTNRIFDCSFAGNHAVANGGVCYIERGDLWVSNCTYTANSTRSNGGAICGVSTNNRISIEYTSFIGNFATNNSGAAVSFDGVGDVDHCLFANNRQVNGGSYGGGALCARSAGAAVAISFTTFVSNSTPSRGGSISVASGASVSASNSIFYGNSTDGGFNGPEVYTLGTFTAAYCNIDTSKVTNVSGIGAGIINVDPQFAYPASGDYHLKSTEGRWSGSNWVADASNSACIDAGDPSTAIGTEPAPNGGIVNLGRYGGTVEASKTPAPPDGDGDGMDDDWETTHFGDLSHTGTEDTDGDGLWDRYEFEHGTIPTNAADPAVDTHYVVDDNPNAEIPYTNWYTAAATIQDAVEFTSHGDTIAVSNGVYDTGGRSVDGESVTNRVCLDKQVTLISENGPENTFIVGVGPLGSNSVRCVYAMADTFVSGFTLTNGHTFADLTYPTNIVGGGIRCDGNATVSNCVIIGNEAGYGGGVYSGIVYNCTISTNVATYQGGGAFYTTYLKDCLIENNTAGTSSGGTMFSDLDWCTVRGNHADWEAGGVGWGMLRNCLIVGNSCGQRGGGAFGSWIESCTIADNHADLDAGGIYAGKSTNSIVYFNSSTSGSNNISGTACQYTCSPSLTSGTGNISADPLFVDRAGSNYRLAAASPCVNAGLEESWMATASDLDGVNRVLAGAVDIGVYEADVHTLTVSAGAGGSVNSGSVNGWYANGMVVTGITATASNGYAFVGWSGDVPPASTNDNPLSLTMNQARTVTAMFTNSWLVPAAPDSYTKLLLHFDDVASGTNFTDSSSYQKSLYPVGSPLVDSAQSRFGAGALRLDWGEAVETAADAAFDYGTNDFTMEAWIKFEGHMGQPQYILTSSYGTSNNRVMLWLTGSDKFGFYCSVSDTQQWRIDGTTTVQTGQWYHVAGVRHGNTQHLYVNGVEEGSASSYAGAVGTGHAAHVGREDPGHSPLLDGWIDEVRISSGIARWTTNFTPRVSPYGVLDSDNDGMQDDWEVHYFGDTSRDGTGDYDGDGITDVQEYLNGSDPTDSLGSGLIAYYPLDGNANDQSGNGFDGSLVGGSFSDGISGSCLLVDGIDDRMDVPAATVSGRGERSYAMWIKTSYTSGFMMDFDVWGGAHPDDYLRLTSSGMACGYYWGDAGTLITNTTPINDNEWHHLALICSGSGTVMYVDGLFVGSHAVPARVLPGGGSSHFVLGCETSGNVPNYETHMQGMLDDVRIYARTLSSNEVAQLYSRDAPPVRTAVTNMVPTANVIGVSTSVTAKAWFDDDLNPGTVTNGSLVVHASFHGVLDDAQVSMPTNGVVSSSVTNLWPGEMVSVVASAGIEGANGFSVKPYGWQFIVGVQGDGGVFASTGPERWAGLARDIALGDLNGDGKIDAVVARRSSQPNHVLIGSGSGSLMDQGGRFGGDTTWGIALGDIDNDGDLDAIAANYGDSQAFRNNGNATFSSISPKLAAGRSTAVALGDLDGDGDLDAVFACEFDANKVFFNDGSGVFSNSGQTLGNATRTWDVALGDVNNDGMLDAVFANNGANKVYLNAGNGSLIDSGQSLGSADSRSLAIADFNGDGHLDLWFGSASPNVVYTNNGSGIFTSTGQSLGNAASYGVTAGDFDGDNDIDVYVANYGGMDIAYRNDGNARFSSIPNTLAADPAWACAHADLNLDGLLDVVVVRDNQTVLTRLNQSPPNAPVSMSPINLNATSFMARWNSVGGATGYALDVATSSNFVAGTYLAGYSNIMTGAVTEYFVNGTVANTSYYYRVRSVSSSGVSTNSSVRQVDTPDYAAMALSDTDLTFNSADDLDPAFQTFVVTNIGQSTMTYTNVLADTNTTWLTISPRGATLNPGGTQVHTVQVAVASAGLAVGSYSTTSSVISVEAENSPVALPITVNVSVPTRNVTVSTDHGTGDPTAGVHAVLRGTNLTLRMSNPLVGEGVTTQYVCTGWAGTGDIPASGSGTSVTATVSNDSAITWQWQTNYYLDVTASNGWVSRPDGFYSAGSGFTLVATWNSGYHFTGWTGDVVSGSRFAPITMDGPKSVTANFAPNIYTINASAGPNGTITPSGAIQLGHGDSANFTITASNNYRIVDVVVDGSSVGPTNKYTFDNVTGNHTIEASFVVDTYYDLTVYSAQGTPTPAGNSAYAFNTNVSCSVSGSYDIVGGTTQYVCTGWAGSGSVPLNGGTTNVDFVITENSSLKWLWETNYYLTFDASGGGEVDRADGWFDGGTQIVVKATASNHYHFTGWTGTVVTNVNPLTVTVDQAYALTANFEIDTFTLDVSAGDNGNVAPTGLIKVTYGYATNIIITPDAHYHVDELLLDSVPIAPTSLYEFASVDTNHTLSASFAIDTFDVVVRSPWGSPAPAAGTQTCAYGTSVDASVQSPATFDTTQYVCTGWIPSGNVPPDGGTTNVSFVVTNQSSLTWTWETNYWLSVTSLGNGAVTVDTQGWVNAGFLQQVEAIPDEGYFFNEWQGDVSLEESTNRTFALVMDRARSIQADFVPVPPVVYVDQAALGDNDGTSWSNAFSNLQDALAVAVVSQAIWIAEGTYTPGTNRSDSFVLPERIPIFGGFTNGASSLAERNSQEHTTILSGDIGVLSDAADNSYHVATATGVVSVCGVTFSGGNANGADNDALGGAIYIESLSSYWSTGCLSLVDCVMSNNTASEGAGVYVDMQPMRCQELVLSNCVFRGNVATTNGGAIGISGYRARYLSLSVVDSRFVDNRGSRAGGAMYVSAIYANASLTASGCRFVGNTATNVSPSGQGGAVWWDTRPTYTAGGVISNCVFVNNRSSGFGGAVYAQRLRRPIVDCDFIGNETASFGGALYLFEHGSAEIACSRFGGNVAGYGGAVYSYEDSPVFRHCEFTGNFATSGGNGGALYLRKMRTRTSVPELINCTVVNNAEPVGREIFCYTMLDLEFQPSIVNTIVWNEQPGVSDVFYLYNGATVTGSYSCVKSDLKGPGMITNEAPGFADPKLGTWTADPVYDAELGVTRLETSTTNFTAGYLVGSYLRPSISDTYGYLIVSNGAHDVWVLGAATNGISGEEFGIRNYLLAATNSPCVDSGIYVGYPYSGSAPDMGVHEQGARARVRVWLGGAYDDGVGRMRTSLRDSGFIPAIAPYAADPRVAASVPTNAVDWVLLELRDSPSSSVAVAQSVFVGDDGYLLTDEGDTDVGIDAASGSYYLVVKHRNHVSVMSATPVIIGVNDASYDFTTSSNCYYGGESNALMISGGDWGMVPGNTDGDSSVQAVDEAIMQTQVGSNGYYRGDFDLNGTVEEIEDSAVWMDGLGVQTKLPRARVYLQPELPMETGSTTILAEHGVVLRANGGTSNVWWGQVQNESGSTSLVEVATGETFTYWAGISSGIDKVEAWDGGNRLGLVSINVISEGDVAAAGKAVIIAGRQSESDQLWPTTDYLAGMAYDTLIYRGFSSDTVQYLSPAGPGADVDGYSSLDEVRSAFTNWAYCDGALFVYLVDHGGSNNNQGAYLKLNKDEQLLASDLDLWLDNIQETYTNDVVVVVDCCQSGSFIDALTYNGPAKRIVVAASGSDQPTYFIAGGLASFSESFFGGVLIGSDLADSFTYARDAMQEYQTAEVSDLDAATGVLIGASHIAARDVPQIGRVVGQQGLMGATEADLWADDIVSTRQIEKVWCSVVPVDHQPSDPSDPVTDLVDVNLVRNPSSGRYEVTYQGFSKAGTYTVFFYARDTSGAVSPPRQTSVIQSRFDERVIIVVGGVTSDSEWETANILGNRAYHTFRSRLFDNDHIQYLNDYTEQELDDETGPDVDGVSTLTNLEYAVTNWADVNESDELTIYLVGYGTTNEFYLNRDETLDASTLAGWLNYYQEGNDRLVNVFLDFHGSGSFIPVLQSNSTAQAEGQRICVASTRANRKAVFANAGSVSFSQYLLSGLFNGKSVGSAVKQARKTIRRASGRMRQVAEIDDNGNGLPNEKNVDGVVAMDRFVGSAFVTGADTPVIGDAIEDSSISNETQLTIWAEDVTDADGISNVWCVLTLPDYDGSGDLPKVELAWQETLARYEAVYTNFIADGQYSLSFYASDLFGDVSLPVQRRIIKAKTPVSENGVDEYENDSSRRHARHTIPGVETYHDFHSEADEDWVWFVASSNLAYDIETVHIASNGVDTILDLYFENSDGYLELVDHVDLFGFDEGELLGLDFPPSGIYFLRVSHDTSQGWSKGGYTLRIDVPIGLAAGNSLLYVQVVDRLAQNSAPAGTKVVVEGETFAVGPDGVFTRNVAGGSYTVSITNFAEQYMSPDTNTWPMTKTVDVPSVGYGYAYFVLLPYTRLSGPVRDAFTGGPVSNAAIRCSTDDMRLGLGETLLMESFPNIDGVPHWQTGPDGNMPDDVYVPMVNVDVEISADGYETNTIPSYVTIASVDSCTSSDYWLSPVDTNGNGIADGWEENLPGGTFDPDRDSDGDGMSDGDEYLVGSDPNNPNSCLAVSGDALSEGSDNLVLRWPVSPGRSYSVWSCDDLGMGDWDQVAGPFTAEVGESSMSWEAPAPDGACYYQVRVTSVTP